MSASFENSCAPETRSLIASRLSTENRHFQLHLTPIVRPKNICVLTFYQVTWPTYRERWFKWVTAIRITLIIFEFANLWLDALNERQLPLGTPMEIDCTSAYLHHPLPQCSKIITPIIFSISYELFRLPSAKVPQDYQLLRTFVGCLMKKLTRNNGPFLATEWKALVDIVGVKGADLR